MFAVAIELLAGRYTATQFNDRREPEWPPHPARLMSAMVAAWADNEPPSAGERSALQWLESQEPPDVCCSAERRREVVTHFVPVNDSTALTHDASRTYALVADARQALSEAEQGEDPRAVDRARRAVIRAEAKAAADTARATAATGRESDQVVRAVLSVLPENRSKQGRTYPTVVPDEPTVWFVWRQAEPDHATHRALDGLLARVARLGHSSTLVACRAGSSPPRPAWVPGSSDDRRRLRVPRPGLLERLELAYASHRGREPRLLPAGMVEYRRPGPPRRRAARPLLGGDWRILGVGGQRPLAAVRALAVARALRQALLCHGDQPPPELISGHLWSPRGGASPTVPLDRPHLAVVPLPSVGHRYSDGAVRGVALILPTECADEDRAALDRALASWEEANGLELRLPGLPGGQPVQLTLEDLGTEHANGDGARWLDSAISARRRVMTRSYWCRPARRWRSVTPIALDRFPGDLRSRKPRLRSRAEDEATTAVARACGFAGLPEPVDVTIRLDPPMAGVPAPPSAGRYAGGGFPGYRTGRGEPRVCVHAVLEFGDLVRGPVLIGAGRYLGYGLCLPDVAQGA